MITLLDRRVSSYCCYSRWIMPEQLLNFSPTFELVRYSTTDVIRGLSLLWRYSLLLIRKIYIACPFAARMYVLLVEPNRSTGNHLGVHSPYIIFPRLPMWHLPLKYMAESPTTKNRRVFIGYHNRRLQTVQYYLCTFGYYHIRYIALYLYSAIVH